MILPNFLYQPSSFLLRSYRHMHNRICQIYRLFIYGECSWVQSMLWFFPNSELMLWDLMSTDVFWPIWAWVYQNKTLVSSLYGQFVLKSTHFLPTYLNKHAHILYSKYLHNIIVIKIVKWKMIDSRKICRYYRVWNKSVFHQNLVQTHDCCTPT